MIVCCTAVVEPGCFHRGGQGEASNQPGVAQKSTLFLYKNVVDYNVCHGRLGAATNEGGNENTK